MPNHQFWTGPAGSGKTYKLRQAIEQDPTFALMTATTGIAALNLDSVTINSTLGYSDQDALADRYTRGGIQQRMRAIRSKYKALAIDELSMLSAEALELLTDAANETDLDLILTGDFAQLPPIKAKWAFEANAWQYFAENVTRLEKNWRQEDGKFLEALKLIRMGKGSEGAEALRPLVQWSVGLDQNYEGVTILPINDRIDRFNRVKYMRLTGKEFVVTNSRWGQQRSEWGQIPQAQGLKIGARVMLLANKYDEFRNLQFANGTQGVIKDFENGSIYIENESGEELEVGRVDRQMIARDGDEASLEAKGCRQNQHNDLWVCGGISFYPVRLAYGASVHKTQGITVSGPTQIDVTHHFFGSPHMAYVALSRVRNASQLRIVGTPELLARRVKLDERVLEWI